LPLEGDFCLDRFSAGKDLLKGLLPKSALSFGEVKFPMGLANDSFRRQVSFLVDVTGDKKMPALGVEALEGVGQPRYQCFLALFSFP
jgi:hypothetical protein